MSLGVWVTMVFFSFVSAVGYALHAGMAWMVRRRLAWKEREGVLEIVDPDEEEARKAKARELWIRMTRVEGL